MPGKKRTKRLLVLLAAPPSPFIQADLNLLEAHYPVEVLVYRNSRSQMAWWVLNRIVSGRAGAIMLWFAIPSYGFGVSIIARLLRCPIILITGGYDIAEMPEIGFGSMLRPKLKRLVIGMLKMANSVLTFSDDAGRQVLRYTHPRHLRTVYPAVDTERFRPDPTQPKENLVVTAAYSIGQDFILQKGLDTFVEAARLVPEARFLLIGQFVDDAGVALRDTAPANVEFSAGRLSDEEYLQTFQRARVYVQASAHEGFGVALAESMSAGCVPVVTNATAMPEVVGNTGYLAPFGDTNAFAAAIRKALNDDSSLARAARERVAANFTMLHRERALLREIGLYMRPRQRRLTNTEES